MCGFSTSFCAVVHVISCDDDDGGGVADGGWALLWIAVSTNNKCHMYTSRLSIYWLLIRVSLKRKMNTRSLCISIEAYRNIWTVAGHERPRRHCSSGAKKSCMYYVSHASRNQVSRNCMAVYTAQCTEYGERTLRARYSILNFWTKKVSLRHTIAYVYEMYVTWKSSTPHIYTNIHSQIRCSTFARSKAHVRIKPQIIIDRTSNKFIHIHTVAN